MKKLRIKKLNDKAVLPERAHATDAGMDLTATSKKFDPVTNTMSYGTGIAIQLPKNHVGLLFSRSSVYKTGMMLANCVGVIDEGYGGEIQFKFKTGDNPANQYNVGDRIGQLVVVELPKFKVEEVLELNETDRGEGGFGSTGK